MGVGKGTLVHRAVIPSERSFCPVMQYRILSVGIDVGLLKTRQALLASRGYDSLRRRVPRSVFISVRTSWERIKARDRFLTDSRDDPAPGKQNSAAVKNPYRG